MKSLIFLGCTALVVACGSSSGTAVDGMQTPPLPSSAPQSPQQPSDSVAPTNAQAAPLNPQQPAINPQQPNLGSTGFSCAQVFAKVQAAGCEVAASDLKDCEAGMAATTCRAQWQAELSCIVSHPIACNDNGELTIASVCVVESLALNACLEIATPQCTSPSCNGCADGCRNCLCRQVTDTGRSCTNECAATN